jgi:hypothetical protein
MLRLPPSALALILVAAAPATSALAAASNASGGLSGLVPPGASSPAATAPASPSARLIDVSVQPSRLFSGQQTTVSGQVVSADDQQRPLAGYAVQAVDGTTTLDQTVTDQQGGFDLIIAPTRSMDIGLQVGPDRSGQPVDQEPVPPIRLLVAPRLPHAFPNRFKLTSVLAVTGSVVPAMPGARLALEQKVGRSFRPLTTTQADDRSRYRFARDFSPGIYVLRVRFLGSADLAPAAYVFRYSVEPAGVG